MVFDVLCDSFFGLFFGAFSLYGAYVLRKQTAIGVASTNWPSVQGRVTESRTELVDAENASYELVIRYTYVVDENELRGDTLGCRRSYLTNLDSVQEIVSAYPSGMNVDVYYDPNDVSKSLLEPGVDSKVHFRVTAILGVFLVVGLLLLANGIRSALLLFCLS